MLFTVSSKVRLLLDVSKIVPISVDKNCSQLHTTVNICVWEGVRLSRPRRPKKSYDIGPVLLPSRAIALLGNCRVSIRTSNPIHRSGTRIRCLTEGAVAVTLAPMDRPVSAIVPDMGTVLCRRSADDRDRGW